MRKAILLAWLLSGVYFGVGAAHAFQKNSAASAKPVVLSKPASSGAPRGVSVSTAKSAGAAGPSTSHPAGPTTSNPGGRGPTTSNPSGRGPTTSNPAARAATQPAPARGPVPSVRVAPAGSRTAHTPDGKDVRTRADGTHSDVRDPKRGMDIPHGLNGDRRVSVERADHSRVVAERGGRGYVQHPYMYRGREYGHRTYYYRGRAYDRFYRRYEYRGVYLDVYAPAFYYPAAFYGWVYSPWVTPVPYAWGFAANPWYGYYGSYFAPYPVYSNASMWLTDYMISNDLSAAYEDRGTGQAASGAAPAGGQVALSPDVKQQISTEVQRQLALENYEAQAIAQNQDVNPQSSGAARMLTDGASHVFIAGRSLDLLDTFGRECLVSEGDVLQLTAPPPPNAASANLTVLASKGGAECGRGKVVVVALNDMQDMQNQMREAIDQGLAELQSNQGKGGLPAAPESAKAAPAKAPFAVESPPPDTGVAAEINRQTQEADAAEKEIAPESGSGPSDGGGSGGPPAGVSLGQTVSQVTAVLGPPRSMADVGDKKIYVYPDVKVTFTAGKASNIQ